MAPHREEEMPDIPSTFTNRDRDLLITVSVKLDTMGRDFDHLRTSLERSEPPSKKDMEAVVSSIRGDYRKIESNFQLDIRELDGRIRVIENFRWWILGVAIASGWISHIVLSLFNIH